MVSIIIAVDRQIINDVICTPNTWIYPWVLGLLLVVLEAIDVVPIPDSVANIAL